MAPKNGVLRRVLDRIVGRARKSGSPPHDTLYAVSRAREVVGSDRRVVAIQAPGFDKGGLEEVVLSLARNLSQFTDLVPVVLVGSGRCGHLADKATAAGVPVIPLHEDPAALRHVLDQLDIAVLNTHYETFGFEQWTARGIPIVYTIQNVYVWASPEFVAQRKPLYDQVTRFVAVSDHVADFHVRKFGLPAERVSTVANGVDLSAFADVQPAQRSELGIADDTMLFINVASFNWNKFQIALVLAAEQLAARGVDAHTLIVGNVHDPDCYRLVTSEIARRNLQDKVTVLDFVTKDRIVALLAAADCFAMPSIVEGCSNASVEALAAGLPLVMSDVGGARMLVRGSDFGHVIPNVGDPLEISGLTAAERHNREMDAPNLTALVDAMQDVAQDRAIWRQRAAAGRAHVEAGFSATAMSRGYAEIFQALVRS